MKNIKELAEEMAAMFPGGLADLEAIAREIDKANPELRKTFENEVKDEINNDDLNEFVEEIEEIFEHKPKP